MDKNEVRCPECGMSFPGETVLAWHRDSVHSVPDPHKIDIPIEPEEPTTKIFGKEIKPTPAVIDTPTITPAKALFSFVSMVVGGFVCFFVLRWVWSLGLASSLKNWR